MYLEKCSESQLEEIYREFNITKESLKRDVNYLIEWMEKQPHLPNVKDEDWISHALIQCKNSIEKTKRHLDLYYSTKALLPIIFANRDPTDDAFKTAFNTGCIIPLPKLTPEEYRIFMFRNFDSENCHLLNPDIHMKMTLMNMDINMKGDLNKKLIFIYDFKKINMSLATTMFSGARKYASAHAMYNFRFHQVHLIVNLNPTLLTFINITKTFMKKKMTDRLVVWNNENPDLTTLFPAEILPEDYGGKEKPLKELHEMYYQYICEFREWLKSEEPVKADLSKRTDDLFKMSMDESVDGSFRQLIID